MKLMMIDNNRKSLGFILCTLWPDLTNELDDGVIAYDPTVVSLNSSVSFKQVTYLEVYHTIDLYK